MARAGWSAAAGSETLDSLPSYGGGGGEEEEEAPGGKKCPTTCTNPHRLAFFSHILTVL